MKRELIYIKLAIERVIKKRGFIIDSKFEDFLLNHLKKRFKIYTIDEDEVIDELSYLYRTRMQDLEAAIDEAIVMYKEDLRKHQFRSEIVK